MRKARPRKGHVPKSRKQTNSARAPRTAQDKIFCQRWLVHNDHNRAYVEAGFKYDSAGSLRKLAAMKPYLERMNEKVESVLAKRISFERADILEAMAQIGFANAQDYYIPFQVIDQETKIVKHGWRLKEIHELSRAQAAAIDNIQYDIVAGRMAYTLPDSRTRLKALQTLGENTKALNKKEPSDVQRHLHLHASFEDLQKLEAEFVRIFGQQEAYAVLGLQPEDQND